MPTSPESHEHTATEEIARTQSIVRGATPGATNVGVSRADAALGANGSAYRSPANPNDAVAGTGYDRAVVGFVAPDEGGP